MPHVQQCDLVFLSNIHKQEQSLQPNRRPETRRPVSFLLDSTANNYLAVYFNNTHQAYEGGRGNAEVEVHKRHTQAPAFMPAGFMSWSAKAINKLVVSRCVFTRKGPEKIKNKATKANKARKRAGLFVNMEAFLNPSQKLTPHPPPPPASATMMS